MQADDPKRSTSQLQSLKASPSEGTVAAAPSRGPWNRNSLRWALVNLSPKLSEHSDPDWWRHRWQQERIQGVIIAPGERYKTLAGVASDQGLYVVARLESSELPAAPANAAPAWSARDAHGQEIALSDSAAPCIARPEYLQSMAKSMEAVAAQFRPNGFVGHGWSALGRDRICYCATCSSLFQKTFSHPLPAKAEWTDPAYRSWVAWSYAQRVEAWTSLDYSARAACGEDCRWVGFVHAGRVAQAFYLQDVHAVAAVAPMLLVEADAAGSTGRFRDTVADGRFLSGMTSSQSLVLTAPLFRTGKIKFHLAAGQAAESRLKIFAGLAGGLQPCFENGTGPREKVRASAIVQPLAAWHDNWRPYLADRAPLHEVGLVWSARSNDVYGQDHASLLCDAPYRGFIDALSKANYSYRPIHQDDLSRSLADVRVLILPNVGSMSEMEMDAVRKFVSDGGTLIATGETSLYDATGATRPNYGLADVFGAQLKNSPPDRLAAITWFGPLPFSITPPKRLELLRGPASSHDYLRLSPEKAAGTPGPHKQGERNEPGVRHPILAGFDKTDVLAFGGVLQPLEVHPARSVLLTLVPPFPSYPIDLVYTSVDRSDIPGLIVGDFGKGRVAFMPADIDRRYGIDPIADHRALLENLLRWATGGEALVSVSGTASIGSTLYRQDSHLLLHLLNYTGADNQANALAEFTPVGPVQVRLTPPADLSPDAAFLLTEGGQQPLPTRVTATGISFSLAQMTDHALILIQ